MRGFSFLGTGNPVLRSWRGADWSPVDLSPGGSIHACSITIPCTEPSNPSCITARWRAVCCPSAKLTHHPPQTPGRCPRFQPGKRQGAAYRGFLWRVKISGVKYHRFQLPPVAEARSCKSSRKLEVGTGGRCHWCPRLKETVCRGMSCNCY